MPVVSTRSLMAVSLALLWLAAPAFTEGEVASELPGWSRPKASDEMDRIVLKSGETLYGDFEGMRNRKAYFDSAEFDNLDFNWSKVVSVHLTESHIFRLSDRNVMGTAEMCEGLIRVRTNSGEIIEFERRKLIGITRGGEEEASHWSGEIGVDFSASDGNTAQIDVSGHVHFQRETGLTRCISDYRGVDGEVDGDKNAENHRASSALDIFLTSRLFLTTPVVEFSGTSSRTSGRVSVQGLPLATSSSRTTRSNGMGRSADPTCIRISSKAPIPKATSPQS